MTSGERGCGAWAAAGAAATSESATSNLFSIASPSAARDRHALDQDRAAAVCAAHHGVTAGRGDAAEHVLQISRHGHLFDGKGDLAVLHPVAARSARVVAGDEVDAVAEHLGDEKAAPELLQHAAQIRA